MCLKLKNAEFQWGNVFNVYSNSTHVIHVDKRPHVLHLTYTMPVENISVCLYRYRKDVWWAGPSWFICAGSGLPWWSGNVQLYIAVQWMGDFGALSGESLLQDFKFWALMGPSSVLWRNTTEDNQHGGVQAVPWQELFWHCKPLSSALKHLWDHTLLAVGASLWDLGLWSPPRQLASMTPICMKKQPLEWERHQEKNFWPSIGFGGCKKEIWRDEWWGATLCHTLPLSMCLCPPHSQVPLCLCWVICGIKWFSGVWGFKKGAPQQIKELV